MSPVACSSSFSEIRRRSGARPRPFSRLASATPRVDGARPAWCCIRKRPEPVAYQPVAPSGQREDRVSVPGSDTRRSPRSKIAVSFAAVSGLIGAARFRDLCFTLGVSREFSASSTMAVFSQQRRSAERRERRRRKRFFETPYKSNILPPAPVRIAINARKPRSWSACAPGSPGYRSPPVENEPPMVVVQRIPRVTRCSRAESRWIAETRSVPSDSHWYRGQPPQSVVPQMRARRSIPRGTATVWRVRVTRCCRVQSRAVQ